MKENNEYLVYKHTNKNNGYIYIGITHNDPETRWRQGHGYKSQETFFNAIIEYGWRNFKHEIIKSNLTKEEAAKLESKLIDYYKNKGISYNTLNGILIRKKKHIKYPDVNNEDVINIFGEDNIDSLCELAFRRKPYNICKEIYYIYNNKSLFPEYDKCDTPLSFIKKYLDIYFTIQKEGSKKMSIKKIGNINSNSKHIKAGIVTIKKSNEKIKFESAAQLSEILKISAPSISNLIKKGETKYYKVELFNKDNSPIKIYNKLNKKTYYFNSMKEVTDKLKLSRYVLNILRSKNDYKIYKLL